jgi:hypothetical protein
MMPACDTEVVAAVRRDEAVHNGIRHDAADGRRLGDIPPLDPVGLVQQRLRRLDPFEMRDVCCGGGAADALEDDAGIVVLRLVQQVPGHVLNHVQHGQGHQDQHRRRHHAGGHEQVPAWMSKHVAQRLP